ncbi:hypothetical protein [Reinekea sp. G2M2-21]|uniref:hypothetical protein n=1 Tax=Reinekea sp. G2M2-21 TaxID=2788942 RepID=UPI0018A8F111|nr:hypothetical protein [Reinekea sp. G2M2-21]
MKFRLLHLGLGILVVPVTYFYVSVYLGDLDPVWKDFFPVLISTVLGFGLAILYAELFVKKIIKHYWLVTMLVGLAVMSILFLLNLDEFYLIDPLIFNLAFVLFAYSYKS